MNFSSLLKLTFILESEQAKKKWNFFQKRVFRFFSNVLSVLFLLDTLMISRQAIDPICVLVLLVVQTVPKVLARKNGNFKRQTMAI